MWPYTQWIRKKETIPFTGTCVVLDIILNGVRQTNHIPYDITYMQNIKYDTNEPIYKRLTDVENKLMATQGEKRRRGGINQEVAISKNTLLYIK